VVLIGVVIIFNLCCFIINEKQQVVITQWGNPVKVIVGSLSEEFYEKFKSEVKVYEEKRGTSISIGQGAGLYFKIPFIQQINYFSDQVLEYDANPTDIVTKDKKHMLVDNFARWRIYNPLSLLQTVKSEQGAQSRLDDIIYSLIRVELGQNDLIEIVRSTNREIETTVVEGEEKQVMEEIHVGRQVIMDRVLKEAKARAYEFGIDIIDVRIKRADLPEQNKLSIFGRMNAERQRISNKYEQEGKREATKIRAETDRDVKIILAEAKRNAQRIFGEGDAEALKIYAEGFTITEGDREGNKVLGYESDPEFYKFFRSMEALEKTVDGKTEFILSTENDLFRYVDKTN
jgi:membrane protease subunit HflC